MKPRNSFTISVTVSECYIYPKKKQPWLKGQKITYKFAFSNFTSILSFELGPSNLSLTAKPYFNNWWRRYLCRIGEILLFYMDTKKYLEYPHNIFTICQHCASLPSVLFFLRSHIKHKKCKQKYNVPHTKRSPAKKNSRGQYTGRKYTLRQLKMNSTCLQLVVSDWHKRVIKFFQKDKKYELNTQSGGK